MRPVHQPPAIVALGGGHGLFATLSAARRLSRDVTAVVTVADDGGSSGRLRAELGVIPPGDLRMALAALAADDPEVQGWTDTIQHRFGGIGALAGHSVGNLILAGLTEVLGDPVAALDELARLLRINGRVLPMSPIALDIEADVQGLEADPRVSRCIRGQVAVATTPGKVRRVRLLPANPPACPDAVRAIDVADMVVLGPGSWFSSVIPHVLVPELLDTLIATAARKVLVLNLAPEPGETAGFSTERHLHVLSQHAPELTVDFVVVDSGSVPPGREREHLARAAGQFQARVVYADVSEHGTHTHHAGKLASVLEQLWSDPDAGSRGSEVAETPEERESASWQ
ncbi:MULTISPECIES: uridine diphosphate-N-acetylglucosamine-binding protein YvcK [Rhodococcus]|uniref:Putative gluconeogenesis factor n=1 Tax=Rhodococcus jostii TaxID=132919 RepID=A0ABU4C717_RHOJO|nr:MULTISPECIES: uridine diphosphate-N-acetylglucosamine-binding protein YvcK [Rhodococcus]MDI9951829.1 uridine diphosphate-N-acetylglucosamine-binding protein YvcK [Rhodococcus sp. IEGM 1305]MDI9974534.1 uridine diphosphate-N-acetylglucosamine-binding protein YvcK [Rhodococcus sp. IEGM 1307]MDV6279098.1 uridine diphosphate-N-acetylglucosamine-binding protein YvcK [Rhodococcus jostii]